jgi:drug/metabolite transporter (DMT)-like permease
MVTPEGAPVSIRIGWRDRSADPCYTGRVQLDPKSRVAFAALLAGAVGIAFAPLLVRWSEVGPSATAFYRLLLALPFLWIWQGVAAAYGPVAGSPASPASRRWPWLLVPGCFFAADLALWHWSIRLTSVANATLFANLAPIVVTVAARFLFGEQIRLRFLGGLALALTGAALVVGASFRLSRQHVWGDVLGLATAVFYGGYLLSVKFLRQSHPTLAVLIWSSAAACPLLLLAAWISREALFPVSAAGWGSVLALALVSQIGGQGLIAFAFRHLPASFSSLSLLIQPVVAALLAWVILGEPLTALQILGGMVVLSGITVASRIRLP